MSAIDRSGLLRRRRHPGIPGGMPQDVAHILDEGVRTKPHGEALVSRHARLTYAELDDLAARAAGALAAMGIRSGDRVAASMSNHAELVVAFLATMRIGAIWVGVNKALAGPEVRHLLVDAGAALLIGDAAATEHVRSAQRDLPELSRVVVAEPGAPNSEWAGLVTAAAPIETVSVDPFAPAAIAYTSGTTGRPKGAVHSQHNMLLPGAVRALTPGREPMRQGVCLPLTILNLVILGPLVTLQCGEVCVLMDRVDAVGIAEWVREERLTSFAAVPAMVYDLLTNPAVTADDLRSLVRPSVGGAACPQALRELYEERFGARVTSSYGLTEAPTAVTLEDPSSPRMPGTAGRPLSHVQVTIRDDAGNELPVGDVGEVCVAAATAGPFSGVYTPMLGYWERPEDTAAAFHEGGDVLRTGDLGYMGASGDLFITDRKNDVIIRGGANVYPAEVERVLSEIRGVAGCAVVGLPDDRLGERVAAAVVLEPGAGYTPEELRQQCSASLSRYKVPDRILIVEELPTNAMGKVVKRRVAVLLASMASRSSPA